MSRVRRSILFALIVSFIAFSLTAAPATALRVTLPETVYYGHYFDFTVEAVDGTGAVDPTYRGKIRFSYQSFDPSTQLPDYTFTAGDAGVHTFTTRLNHVGDDRFIRATDVSNASITGSDTTDVRNGPGATQRFVITAPATGNLGQPFNFTVTAVDANGNVTPDYTGTIEFQAHGVVRPPNYTFTPADAGTKTFTTTPDRGGYVLFNLYDVEYIGIAANHSMQIACPGFTVTASNNGPVCPTQAPTLTATTDETDVTFEWRGPNVWNAFGRVVNGVFNYEGTYSVTMTHATNGCTAFAETFVELSSTNPDVERLSEPSWFCDQMEKQYAILDSATNGPYTNIVWTVNGSGSIVRGQGTTTVTILPDFNESGPSFQQINLYLSATNGEGCVIENRLVDANIDVYRLPEVTIDTPSSACPGTTLIARPVSAPTTSSSLTYNWTIENGTITERNQTSGEIRYTVSGTGDAVLTLVVSDPHCSYTTTATVSAGPSATIASASHDICEGEAVQIPVTLTGEGPVTIEWSDGLVQTVNGSFTRTVSPQSSTSYSIVSVKNANCRSGETTGSVEVTTTNAPVITRQPADTTVPRGERATLTVDAEPDAFAVQWYRGTRGDRTNRVNGATSRVFVTPPITQTTTFWAEIQTSCGAVASNSVTVSVASRRRAVGHP